MIFLMKTGFNASQVLILCMAKNKVYKQMAELQLEYVLGANFYQKRVLISVNKSRIEFINIVRGELNFKKLLNMERD